MSVLRNLEAKLGGIVEGAFGRAFKTSVQPVELAHKLAKEMEDNQMASVSRVYVPNHYRVFLSAKDREQFASYEPALRKEPVDDRRQALLVGGGRRNVLSGSRVVLGRSREADIVLQDPNVSRRHAEVRRGDDGWHIVDLGSTNGIKVNGRRVESQALRPGDQVTIGVT